MTGAELAAIRLAAGLTQQQLAEQAGIGRHAVSYWETKPRVDRRSWAVCRIGEVLPLPAVYEPPAPVLTLADLAMQSGLAAQVSRLLMRCEAAAAKRRVRCNARTRRGTPCRCQSEPGKQRCKFHGGMSTGPRTIEGKHRIAEAQRKRWAEWRKGSDLAATPA